MIMDKYQREDNEHVTACLIEQQGNYSAYIITPSMLDGKMHPMYMLGCDSVAQVKDTISQLCLEWKFDDFVDYDDFWRIVAEAGIAMSDAMPHGRQQTLLLEAKG